METKKKSLSKKQEATMKKHSKHHTQKHMRMMRAKMMQGMSFTEAHKETQKKVGK
tara:strand:+ start:433 stop:597 length:165 start_codon:yes stop_codon:yes gene_type:complete